MVEQRRASTESIAEDEGEIDGAHPMTAVQVRGWLGLPAQRPTVLDMLAFGVPALAFLEVTLIGRLSVTEILLLVTALILWRAPGSPRVPRWFLAVWAGWLLSQIVTDLLVGSTFIDYARGWAGIFFTLTNFAGILILVSTPNRARLFALGLAVSGLAGLVLAPQLYADIDPWKWGLAMPIGFGLAAAVSGRAGDRRPWWAVAGFLAFGALNLALGYRSLGGVSLLVAAYLSLNAIVGRRRRAGDYPAWRAALGLVFLAVVGLGVLGIYSAAAAQGLLGREEQAKYFDQAGAFGALLGGRSEALVSSQAIMDSPILGHGSWAKDPYYARLLAERQAALGYEVTQEYIGTDLIPAHSYLMGAWVWGGVFGAVFWFVVASIAVWLLANLYLLRIELAPLLVFSTLLLLWDIAFSPYGFGGRIAAPAGLVLCLLGLRLLREGRQGPRRTTEGRLCGELRSRSSPP